ncbi:hypothetical protein [uncultured Alistipes sp.]|uniref:hypothetical protein n=1 Tax=uncultured Alistipes sp. TaxID=538949 RepID=UPI0025888C3D|nr:hypothetical protein [uncultured Alistipes sp.]
MKKNGLIVIYIFFSLTIFAQEKSVVSNDEVKKNATVENLPYEIRYELYPTTNMWTFIKLDTQTGVLTQVQYDVNGNNQGELSINSKILLPLSVSWVKARNGRFKLYPTQNNYNFLLLDQVDGRMWQIQWSMDEEKRGIVYTY